MNKPAAVAAVALTALSLGPGIASASAAEEDFISGGFTCGNSTIDVAVALPAVPTSVSPGETVDLDGTMRVTFVPDALTGLTASTVQIVSSTFFVESHLGSSTEALKPSEIVGDVAAVTRPDPVTGQAPVVVEAPLDLPAFTVASTASGVIELTLPSDPEVSFDVTLRTNGVVQESTLTCAADDTTQVSVAAIPIVPVPALAIASSSTSEDVAEVDSALASADAALSGASSTSGSLLGPSLAAAPVTEAVEASGSSVSKLFPGVPAQTRLAGILIPGWLIVLAVAMIPLGIVAYSLMLRQRIALAQALARSAS
ncbi:MAG: hypothetical protein QM597_00880 [Aeromicrobium sp.]|uniref:hypothetical protein n=1 Tax=Aeromicrobium sp. TaxID=1871063 RepID=UPI0039E4D7A0